ADRRHASPGWSAMTDSVAVLLVVEVSGAEQALAIDGSAMTIGRERGCAVRLDSPYVSRQHARIEVRDAGPTLVDLGSHNGSLLNGVRVQEPALLRVGDVITVADTTITCLAESTAEVPTHTFVAPAARPSVDRQTVPWVG